MTEIGRREFCSALGLATVASLAKAANPGDQESESGATLASQPTNRPPATAPPMKKNSRTQTSTR